MDNSNLKETLKAVDTVILEKKAEIKLGEELKLLKQTEYFKNVIMKGYFETEAKKLFNILTDPSGSSPYSNEEIHRILAGISHFKGYVGTVDYPGTVEINALRAPEDIQREENYRKEVTASFAESGE